MPRNTKGDGGSAAQKRGPAPLSEAVASGPLTRVELPKIQKHQAHRWVIAMDVLKAIILKLQRRVEMGATTLLIKVKDHRGDPLNEEADIRAELDRLKEYKETIWNDSSDRTVYQ